MRSPSAFEGQDFHEALEQGQLALRYQPIVDLQSGAVVSLEALVYWSHPALGLLMPQSFLPNAEMCGMSPSIGYWALERACGDLATWRLGGFDLQVGINVAASQIRDAGFCGAVAAILNQYALPPSALTLEITEATLNEVGASCDDMFSGFRTLGLNLTLNKVGSGQFSFKSLRSHSFHTFKIDADVIRNVATNPDDAAITKSIIAFGHNLGLCVVAVGVETEIQCDFLRRQMCDQIQGDIFAPPLPSIDLQQLLVSGRRLPAHLLRMHRAPRRLLLVDDEPNILAALKRLLRADQYQIYTANDGQQGLAVLAEHPVDVIVSDQRMPGMLGADFLRNARKLVPDSIRIMLSGYTELQSVTDAVNEGAIYKFLTKPWDDEKLRGHIAEAFKVKEIADDNQRLHLEVRYANLELAAANRLMEQLLQEKQRQISNDEISLTVARELLQHLPLPVIGMDDAGMIAFINGAATGLFRHSGALLGSEAGHVLPELFPADGQPHRHLANIEGEHYAVMCYPMGQHSTSRGSLITLSKVASIP